MTMKKISIICAAVVAAVSFSSCTKEQAFEEPQTDNIQFNISVDNFGEPETKALQTNWMNGDVINLWFDGNMSAAPDLTMTYNDGNWSYSALANGTVLNPSGKVKALWEGYNDLSKYTAEDFIESRGYYMFSMSSTYRPFSSHFITAVDYTFEGNVVSATITKWKTGTRLQVVITGLDKDSASNYALNCDKMYVPGGVLLYGDHFNYASGRSDAFEGGMANADGVAFNFSSIMNAVKGVPSDYTFTLKDIKSGVDKTFTATGKTLSQGDGTQIYGIKIPYSCFE